MTVKDYFNIIAFDENWKRKGIVDPSLRDSVVWTDINEALSFVKNCSKPKNEHWVIELAEER